MIKMMIRTSVSSYVRPFVVRCMGLGSVELGMGWVMGAQVYLAVGWVGFGLMKLTHRKLWGTLNTRNILAVLVLFCPLYSV